MAARQRPLISIVIPAYNAADTLAAAMRSVLQQRGAALELIVVDDGSTDRTLAIAEEIAAQNDGAAVVLSQENSGTASALNAGWRTAQGEFVGTLGADDELTADYLETMVRFISLHPGYDIYSHDMWAVTPSGSKTRVLGWNEARSVVLEDLLRECVIPGGGTLVRRELLETLGGHGLNMYNEDYDLWLRAIAQGARHLYAPYPLYIYRLKAGGQKTADRGKMYASAIAMFEDLLSGGTLSAEQRTIAEETVARFQSYLDETLQYGGRTEGQLIEDFAEEERAAVRRALERIVPASRVDGLLVRLRRLAWLARPFRRVVWKVRLRRRKCSGS